MRNWPPKSTRRGDGGRANRIRAQEAQQAGLEQPAPEVMEVLQQTEPQQPQYAPTDGVDPEVRAALQNPKVLAAVQQERVADLMRVEAAVNNATQWAQQNAAVALAAIIARPELQGVPPRPIRRRPAGVARSVIQPPTRKLNDR